MKVNRKELLVKLNLIQPGLTKKEIMDQSTHFVFTGKEIASHNGYISVTTPFETDLQCSVPSDKFYNLLSKIEDEDVEISLDDNGSQILVKSAHVRSGMAIIIDKVIEDRLSTIPQPKKWKKLPKDFVKGLRLCMFSVSKDQYCGALNCVYVSGEDVYSTDNFRVSHYKMSGVVKDKFLLPLIVVLDLVKFKVVEYALETGWALFRMDDDTIFSCRCMLGDYPDASKLFTLEGNKITFPKKLQEVIETVSMIIEDDRDINKRIEITIDGGKIICRAEQERGWIEREMDIKYDGKKAKLSINPVFLYEILDKSSDVIIGDNKALFSSDSFQHIMALPMER
jgi:DNA polymerase III sliding clamp (beta) subunit (PCNA family)